MKVLALIPARNGSKRLPGKNLRQLGEKPLINWTIEVAQQVDIFCDILVSTDGIELASLAREAGAFVPWLRPSELAVDDASSVETAIHALNWYESTKSRIDALVLLQPTSPFRKPITIKEGIKLFQKFSERSVLAVTPQESMDSLSFIQRDDFIYTLEEGGANSIHEAVKLKFFRPNGVLYVVSPQRLREEKSFTSGEIVPLIIDSEVESIDIDTEDDWRKAEKVVRERETGVYTG